MVNLNKKNVKNTPGENGKLFNQTHVLKMVLKNVFAPFVAKKKQKLSKLLTHGVNGKNLKPLHVKKKVRKNVNVRSVTKKKLVSLKKLTIHMPKTQTKQMSNQHVPQLAQIISNVQFVVKQKKNPLLL